MTMKIVYLKDFEGHKAGEDGFEERTRARRLCDNGTVEPYITYQKRIKEAEKVLKPVEVEKEPEKEPDMANSQDNEKPEEVKEPAKEDDNEEKKKKRPGRPVRRKKDVEKAVTL